MLSDYDGYLRASSSLAMARGSFYDKAAISPSYGLPASWGQQCYTSNYIVGLVPVTLAEAKRWMSAAECDGEALVLIGGGKHVSFEAFIKSPSAADDTQKCMLVVATDWKGRTAASLATFDHIVDVFGYVASQSTGLPGVAQAAHLLWNQRLGKVFELVSNGRCELRFASTPQTAGGIFLSLWVGGAPQDSVGAGLQFPLSFAVQSPADEACQSFNQSLSNLLASASVGLRRALCESERETIRLREALAYESAKVREAMLLVGTSAGAPSSEPLRSRGLRSEPVGANGRAVTPPPALGGNNPYATTSPAPETALPQSSGPPVASTNANQRAALRAQIEGASGVRGRGRGVRIGM